MRSAYLWDSWGAAKVNMATISISSLHNRVCRLKAVRHITSRAAEQVFYSTNRRSTLKVLKSVFMEMCSLYWSCLKWDLLCLAVSCTRSGWTKVSFRCNLFSYQIGSSVLKEMHNMDAMEGHPYNAFHLLIPQWAVIYCLLPQPRQMDTTVLFWISPSLPWFVWNCYSLKS